MKTPIEEADFLTIVLQGAGRLQKPRPGWIRIWKQDRSPYSELTRLFREKKEDARQS
jgi:hypothetical protein